MKFDIWRGVYIVHNNPNNLRHKRRWEEKHKINEHDHEHCCCGHHHHEGDKHDE